MIEFIKQPWPWYVAGPLIGLFVPLLLLYGNKNLGISSSMRHICSAVLPTKLSFFDYDLKEVGGVFAKLFLWNNTNVDISPTIVAQLQEMGLNDFSGYAPTEIFSLSNSFNLKGILFFLLGGFLVGFGTRYANGCTSGHSIFGLATFNWPSLIATICFMIGGFISAWFIVPLFLKSVL
jgi:uncharacterized protein